MYLLLMTSDLHIPSRKSPRKKWRLCEQGLKNRRQVGILKKQLGYSREFPHPNLARVIVPTLSYEGLDCSGEKILPWSLMKLFDSCELSDFWPFRDDAEGDHHERVIYIVTYELEVDKALYTPDSPKFPLYIDNTVKFVKRSSRCVESLLRHPDVDKPYARCSGIDVNMDPETRSTKPFPTWWKDHFNFPTDGPKQEFKLPQKPAVGIYKSEHRVYFSDTDENKHANYTTYVKFCYDGFCEHVLARNYGNNLDVYEIGLKKLQINYLKEVKLGDIVTVESWEDSVVEDTYHFEMWNGSILSAVASISFYNLLNTGRESRL